MTWEKALQKALKAYWNNTDEFDALNTSKGNRKYSKKYFDAFEKEQFGEKTKEEKKKK